MKVDQCAALDLRGLDYEIANAAAPRRRSSPLAGSGNAPAGTLIVTSAVTHQSEGAGFAAMTLTCPRCGSRAIMRDHAAVACLSCGRVLNETTRPAEEEPSGFPRNRPDQLGPPWTESERLLWQSERPKQVQPARRHR